GRTLSQLAPPAAFSGVEIPNTYNFSMSIPLLSLQGRGINTDLSLSYNTGLGEITSVNDPSRYYQAPAKGFNFNFGVLVEHNASVNCFVEKVSGLGFCPAGSPHPFWRSPLTFIDSSGGKHQAESSGGLAKDSSDIRIWSGTVLYPNGTTVLFGE